MQRYSVVPNRSRVEVEVQVTLQRFELESAALEGEFRAELDGEGLRGVTGSFALPTESLTSGNRLFDRDMMKALETRKFPRITGEILEVEARGDAEGSYTVRGLLSLHGETRKVTGIARLVELEASHALIEGAMTVDFTEFNLAPRKLLMLRVEPEIAIRGRVYAERQA